MSGPQKNKVAGRKGRLVCSEKNCNHCGLCVKKCPFRALSMDNGGELKIDHERCHSCGRCVRACKRKALALQRS